jgi:cell division protein FtsB
VDPAKNVKAEKLETMVLELIKAHIAVYVDAKDRLRMLNRTEKSVGERAELENEFAGLEERRTKVCDFIRNLYEDFADGILTEEEYLEMKAGYVSEQEKLDADMEKRKSQMDTFDDGYGGEKQMADAFAKYLGADALSRDMVQTFIKKITCYSKDRFEVEYNFADELAALIELADKRGVDVA